MKIKEKNIVFSVGCQVVKRIFVGNANQPKIKGSNQNNNHKIEIILFCYVYRIVQNSFNLRVDERGKTRKNKKTWLRALLIFQSYFILLSCFSHWWMFSFQISNKFPAWSNWIPIKLISSIFLKVTFDIFTIKFILIDCSLSWIQTNQQTLWYWSYQAISGFVSVQK